MEALIIFALIIGAVWTPHLYRGAVTRARYAYRARRGYTPPAMRGPAPTSTAGKLQLFEEALRAHARR